MPRLLEDGRIIDDFLGEQIGTWEELRAEFKAAGEPFGLDVEEVRFSESGQPISIWVDDRAAAPENHREFIEAVELVAMIYFLDVVEIRATTKSS